MTTCRWFTAQRTMVFFPGVFHSFTRLSARMWRIPSGYTWETQQRHKQGRCHWGDSSGDTEAVEDTALTWTKASSPSSEQESVGVVPRKPESVTSSTVSPMDRTKVALTKDTMMYASNSSEEKEKRKSLSETVAKCSGYLWRLTSQPCLLHCYFKWFSYIKTPRNTSTMYKQCNCKIEIRRTETTSSWFLQHVFAIFKVSSEREKW